MQSVKTTCPYCGVGCGLVMEQEAEGPWQVRGDPEHPSNFGKLCSKGTALHETLGLDGRLLTPMIDGRQASWNQALERVAKGFRRAIDEHGPDAVAFYVSGQLLTEDYYVANKLMKGFIGSGNIDTNSRLCMSSSVAGHKRAFGSDSVPGCYRDFEQAELIVLTGSNTAWCHPVLYRRIVRAKENNPQLRVVVVDPRRTATCDVADLHLALRPGSDSLLFSGLLAWLSAQGRIDRGFVDAHTEGAEEALRLAEWYAPTLLAVAQHCALPVADVQRFFQWFEDTEKSITLYSQGINQTSSGTDKVNAIINCHLLTGRIGKPGMGPFSITGQPNAMGGREVGALANQLTCHMDIENQAHRDLVGRFWQAPRLTTEPGLKAVDLFHAVEQGKVKALWVMATNPAVSMPDAAQVRRALERCELLVVSDNTLATDTTAYADVLLPAQGWAEKDGTVSSSERTISRQQRFLRPAGEARPDWWILSQVAQRMGYAGFDYRRAQQIFTEYARLSGLENEGTRDFDISALADLTPEAYDALQPVQWPLPTGSSVGTPRLFADGRFFTPSRRARFLQVIPQPPASVCSAEYPLVLNTGRVRDQWHTMTRSGKSARLFGHDSEPFADLNRQDATARGIEHGELVSVDSRWGRIIVRARVGERQRQGQVFVPIHWSDRFAAQATVGSLVNPVVDPVSGQPEFKHTPVAVDAYRPGWHGFLLSRAEVLPPHASYWARAKRDGLWHYELAGEEHPEDWPRLARELTAGDVAQLQWAELMDQTAGHYRAAGIVDGRLESCLFIGPDHRLPQRDWLVRLFSKPQLDPRERQRLLSGEPGSDREDAGHTVCACFNVGVNQLIQGIRERNLHTPGLVGRELHAGSNCGSCLSEIRALIIEHGPGGG